MNLKSLPPEQDEIEVSLFGSGFGESIAVHLPGDRWILVDSCVAPQSTSSMPVSGEYLDLLGVMPNQVAAIVASHWHSDHTCGLTRLAKTYVEALIYYPNFMRAKEGIEFLASYSGRGMTPGKGTSELYDLFETASQRMIPCGMQTEIVQAHIFNSSLIRVSAMSPMPAASHKALAWVQGQLASRTGYVRHPAVPSPNFSSIAIFIDVGQEGILLGSDLEDHAMYGWTALALHPRWNNGNKAGLYKVAHHGSETGHSPEIWSNLLISSPAAALTPFFHGGVSLPSASDVTRLKGHSGTLHTSSGSSQTPNMPATHLKLLKQIATKVVSKQRKMGHLRFRKSLADTNWRIETFDAAQAM